MNTEQIVFDSCFITDRQHRKRRSEPDDHWEYSEQSILNDQIRPFQAGKNMWLFGISRDEHESRPMAPLHLVVSDVRRPDKGR